MATGPPDFIIEMMKAAGGGQGPPGPPDFLSNKSSKPTVTDKQHTGPRSSFLEQKNLKYLPPYFRDTPETRTEVQCPTKGEIPSWVTGAFIRIGIGRITVPTSEDGSKPDAVFQHFFDGLGCLHKFMFSNGQVRYISRHTSDGILKRAKEQGYVTSHMFGANANTPLFLAQDPCSALLGAQQSVFMPKGHLPPDAANVSVTPRRGYNMPPHDNPFSPSPSKDSINEEIIVQTDAPILQICDAKTLEPKRLLTYSEIDKDLTGYGICAHPPKDRKRGLTFNYLFNDRGQSYVFALDIKSTAQVLWKTVIPCNPCYTHSLAMSEKYVIFVRNPLFTDMRDITLPFMELTTVEPNQPTRFYVLDKTDGKHLATYEAPSFMFFHAVNGYDFVDSSTGTDTVHVDLCAVDSDILPHREYTFSNIADPTGPFTPMSLVRYELENVDKAEPEVIGRATVAQAIGGTAIELPRINKAASMVPGYRYVYGIGATGSPSPGTLVPIGRMGNGLKVIQSAFFGNIVKTDWLTGTFLSWAPDNGESCPCEPIFVGRPGATEEDDGVVLTIVCNREGTKSALIVLDAHEFVEIGRAEMPQVYGLGPHGTFVEGVSMI